MSSQRLLYVTLLAAFTSGPAHAQPVSPPPPKDYRVELRYRIQAARNQRVPQFIKMVDALTALGLQRDPGPEGEAEDATLTRLTGRIASSKARDLLNESHVRSLLLLPPDFKLPGPEDEDKPIKVQLELVSGLPLTQQRLLTEQVRRQLKAFDFREAIAYDHRGYTRLVGTVQGSAVETLLKDLRSEPAGWLTPLDAIRTLPMPLRGVAPIRVTEVIPEPADVPPAKEPPAPMVVAQGQEHLQKISQELRDLLGDADAAAKPARVEIILVATPDDDRRSWQEELISSAPQLVIEGRLGSLVTGKMPPDKAPGLAESAIVSAIRLARLGTALPLPPVNAKGRDAEALKASGIARLHDLGQRGKGVRTAVIAGDFRGWEALVKAKQLPATTRVLDLTRQRVPEIEPEPYGDDKKELGHGTECARALALAAPQADLLLIRVDPAAPHMLLAIARHINGENYFSQLLEQRRNDLDAAFDALNQRWKEAEIERRELLTDFKFDDEAIKKREDHFVKVKALKEEDTAFHKRQTRFLQHQRELKDLSKLHIVANTLSWPEGHLIDGSGPLTRYLNNRPFRTTLWFQPSGDTYGQSWTGLFRDADSNGIMEFAPPTTPIPAGRWTRELNFLAWQPFDGKQVPDLPEKAKLRITVQWREAHDPSFLQGGEDLYQVPLALLRLMVLRQRDPSGTKLATDDMELTTYAQGLPQRIHNEPDSATYEQTLILNVEAAGRYALRVDGKAPNGIRPPDVPSVGPQKQFDLRLRILVEVLDEPARGSGRVVFLDYPTTEGAIGMPGDAGAVWSIGAARSANQAQPFSASGPAMNLDLLRRPSFFAFDGLEVGTGELKGVQGSDVAASFAAGVTATALGAGVPARAVLAPPFARPGGVLRVPENWPVAPPAPAPRPAAR